MKPAATATRHWMAISVGVWVLLTLLGTALHHRIWSAELAPGTVGVSSGFQSIGNVVHMLVSPGWLVIRFFSRGWPTGAWSGPLAANAIGWFIWVAGLWVLWAARRWTLRRVDMESNAEPNAAESAPDLSRRRFLVDGSLIAATAGGVSLLIKGEFLDAWGLTVMRYRVPIADLPPGLDGVRAVLLADTHLGPRIPADFIRRAVRMALELKPDVYMLGGDYIHNGAAFIEPAAALFEPLVRTSRPVVAVRGNHDWYGDGRAMGRALDAIGVRVIDNRRLYLDENSRRVVPDAPSHGGLALVGLGDVFTDVVDAATAFGGLREDMPRVVLAHNPDTAEVLAGRLRIRRTGWSKGYMPCRTTPRIDAMLCGHTHGGQVRIPFLGTPVIPCWSGTKYAGGVVQGPGYPVVVSRGVGMSILPIRLGVPPEIVEVTFVRG